jgi:hypothetical protein
MTEFRKTNCPRDYEAGKRKIDSLDGSWDCMLDCPARHPTQHQKFDVVHQAVVA